jgi:AcrR family transcriptional regulator
LARGKPREQAILAGALQVLEARGYASMTIDSVAARARASKATIYRRWANKAELVKAALDSLAAERSASIPDTGALRADLFAVMKALREQAAQPYADMMRELCASARRDEVLAALLRDHTESEASSPFQEVLRRAIRRRTLSRSVDTELVHEVVEALILRQLQTRLPFDDAFIARVVDRVVLPLLKPTPARK